MDKEQVFKKNLHLGKAYYAWTWSLGGTILPFILCSIVLMAYSKSQSIIDFVDKGDFCLYSAGLLSSAIFILTDNKENIKKWHNHILYPFSFFLIAVAAALYLAIYIAGDVFKDTKINISSSFVRWTSMILIILSMIVILRSLIIDFRYRPKKVDVAKKQHEAVQDIMDKLGN